MVKRSKTCIHLIKDPLKFRVKYMKTNCQIKKKNKFIHHIMEAFNNAFPETDRTSRKNKSVGDIRLNNTITLTITISLQQHYQPMQSSVLNKYRMYTVFTCTETSQKTPCKVNSIDII